MAGTEGKKAKNTISLNKSNRRIVKGNTMKERHRERKRHIKHLKVSFF